MHWNLVRTPRLSLSWFISLGKLLALFVPLYVYLLIERFVLDDFLPSTFQF